MKIPVILRKFAILLAVGGFVASYGMAEPLFSGSSMSSAYKIVRTERKDCREHVYYTVKRGDTLAKIAKITLGDSSRWLDIARANPEVNPQRMSVGSRLMIPDVDIEESLVLPVQSSKGGSVSSSVMEKDQAAPAPDLSYIDTLLLCNEAVETREKTKPTYVNENFVENQSNTSHFSGVEYELPENLKLEEASPYFVNARGLHGVFNTESAMYPPVRTLNVGMHLRYDKYSESPYGDFKLTGSQWRMPLNILFLRNRLMVGATLPVQSWEVKRTDGTQPSVSMSSLHDPAIRFGYQVWSDQSSEQAVSLHFEGRFPSGNYHQPKLDMTDKTRSAVQVGPAEATRGGWLQLGGAYSRRLSERWNSHFNLTLASNPRDRMTRITPTSALEYSLSDSCILLAEADAPFWSLEKGPDGGNIDILLGVAWYTPRWQISVGVPVGVKSDWGYEHDIGFQLGMNYRQD